MNSVPNLDAQLSDLLIFFELVTQNELSRFIFTVIQDVGTLLRGMPHESELSEELEGEEVHIT